MAFAPVNEIRLTSARYWGSKQEKDISALFQTAATDVAKHRAPKHWYPTLKAQHRAFSLNFIITLKEDILLLEFKLIFLLRQLADTLDCSYFPNNSSGWGDVFISSLTSNSNNHLCIKGKLHGEIRISITDSWLIPAAEKRGQEKEDRLWRQPENVDSLGEKAGDTTRERDWSSCFSSTGLEPEYETVLGIYSPRYLQSSLKHLFRRALSKFCFISYMASQLPGTTSPNPLL